MTATGDTAAARRRSMIGVAPLRAIQSWALPIAAYSILTAYSIALHATTVNADLWVRLAAGRLVIEEGIIPRQDPFTFTVPGRDWLDHEWLLGAAFYLLHSVSYELLVVVAALLALAPFLIVHRIALKDRPNDWRLTALIVAAMLAAWRTYAIRPQLVVPLAFAIVLLLIDDRRRTGSRRVWLTVPVVLLAANLHGGFPAVLGLLAAWLLAAFWERRDRTVASAVFVAALAMPLFNVYGLDLYRYALSASLSGNTDRAMIPEWQTPDFHDPLNLPTLAVVLLFGYFGARSSDPYRRLLAIGTLAATLVSVRFVPFFALSMVYAVAPQLGIGAPPQWLRRAALAVLPLLAMLAGVSVIASARNDPPTDEVPVEGLAYLRQTDPGARLYADQSWASYMTWSGWPTFFDTRTHQVFPESLIADYHRVERTRGNWMAVLDRWQIEYVMMAPDSDLADALDGAGWPRVFEGAIEVIWRRPN